MSTPEAPPAPSVDEQIAALLADDKRITGDLRWQSDEDGPHAREFVAPVRCAAGELRVLGQRCAAAGSLRFSLIFRGLGRICALDLGHPHAEPDGQRSGTTHFHVRGRPTRELPDLDPDDITGAWRLFCTLGNLVHDGALADPAPAQETLL